MKSKSLRTVLATAVLTALAAFSTAQAADIIPVIFDAPGTGYYDPTPATPVGGNVGTTVGEQRRIVAQYAAALWGTVLESEQPVYIGAQFTPLAPNVLGSAGATFANANFANVPYANTYYAAALSDAISGVDLNPGFIDINSNFSTNFTFYYGLDGNTPAGLVNFLDVVMHEYAHGLGFANFENEGNGRWLGATNGNPEGGLPDIYSVFTYDNTAGQFWTQMTRVQRVASAINDGNVVFTGARATAGAKLILDPMNLLKVTAPGPLAGNYKFGAGTFGPAPSSANFNGQVVQATDAANASGPTTTDGCTAITNAAAIAGKVALIDRGTCGFTVKVKNAQDAGAIAVVIADNAAGQPAGLGGADPTITIPSVRISLADGNLFKANLPATVSGFVVDPTRLTGADAMGHPQLFMPPAVQSGSSGSHYDSYASPNLLMEPAINGTLRAYYNLDITPALLADIGWKLNTGNSTMGSPNILDCDTGIPAVNNVGLMAGATVTASHEMCLISANTRTQYKSCMDAQTDRLVASGLLTSREGQKVGTCVKKVVDRTRFPIPQ